MKRLICAIAAMMTAAAAAPVIAQSDSVAALLQRTEKVALKGRRGESLLRPGFAVGEYVGGATSTARAVDVPGFHASDKLKADFNVEAPSLGGKVTGACVGGQSRTGLGWITFDRDPLEYACSYDGPGKASGATLTLALSKGSLMARLQQPQRAGELRWGGSVIRAETRQVGGMPFGGGRVMGYVFTRDGNEIGALNLNGIGPVFYLPPKGDPDRDAVALLGLSLFFFQDPAGR